MSISKTVGKWADELKGEMSKPATKENLEAFERKKMIAKMKGKSRGISLPGEKFGGKGGMAEIDKGRGRLPKMYSTE